MKFLHSAIIALSLLCSPLSGHARPAAAGHEKPAGRPSLVLAIVVDQLRTDYLEYLAPLMGRGGFARLRQEGAYLRNVQYAPSRLDAPSATAMLFTGATPDRTGVAAASRWDAASLKMVPALADTEVVGNFTSDSYSPGRLRLSTITDEIMIDGAGLGQAWAIASDPQVAVAMASHAGSGAVWLDRNSGKWCSSTYYSEMPRFISERNYRRPLSSRIDTMQWKPMLPLDAYPGLPAQKRYYPFRHTFPSSSKDVYERFAASPKANTEITDLAVECLNTLHLGSRGDAIDMLCVGYTAAPFKYVKDGDFRLELADTYLRLDHDLARLMAAADKCVGAGQTLVVLLSTGYYDDATIDDEKYRIPTGTFSVKRAASLLNAFMTARHGQGNYISSWTGGTVWLNRQLLESRNIPAEEAARSAKEFLAKLSGVESVYTMSDLLSSSSAAEEALRLSIDPQGGADLVVEISPGWLLCEDNTYPVVTRPVRRGIYPAPALLLGPGIPAGYTADYGVSALSLAPTVTGAMRMRQPNGTTTAPLTFPSPR